MSIRRELSSPKISKIASSIIRSSLTTRSEPITLSRIDTPLPGHVEDMSITGLQMSAIIPAVINHFKLGPADYREQLLTPLGR